MTKRMDIHKVQTRYSYIANSSSCTVRVLLVLEEPGLSLILLPGLKFEVVPANLLEIILWILSGDS